MLTIKGDMIINCPNCGKAYNMDEFKKLEQIINISDDVIDARKCIKCGTDFYFVKRHKDLEKEGNIVFSIDLDLETNKKGGDERW